MIIINLPGSPKAVPREPGIRADTLPWLVYYPEPDAAERRQAVKEIDSREAKKY